MARFLSMCGDSLYGGGVSRCTGAKHLSLLISVYRWGGGYYTFWQKVQQILEVLNSSIRPSSCLRPWRCFSSGGVIDRIVGRVIRVHVVRHVFLQDGCLDVVYQRVGIGVRQFGTRSVLAQNFFVILYMVIFENSKIQKPR